VRLAFSPVKGSGAPLTLSENMSRNDRVFGGTESPPLDAFARFQHPGVRGGSADPHAIVRRGFHLPEMGQRHDGAQRNKKEESIHRETPLD
jgi:hypothetical protein